MSKAQVTTAPPDERYMNRFTGALVVNTAEVNRIVEARLTPAQREVQNRGRMSVDGLEIAFRALREREADRQAIVDGLRPMVSAAEMKVDQLKEQFSHAEECASQHMIGARVDAIHLGRKLRFAEDAFAAIKVRLDTSERILASCKSLVLDWLKQNGAELQKLHKLNYKRR
jgi:hypothetical protein